MKLTQLTRPAISTAILLLLLSSFVGCESLKQAQLEKQEKNRQAQRERYLTLERSDAQIRVSSDGLKIESDHYILSFADDLQKNKDFDEVKERQDWGRGALVFMESLYDYVHDIFGFEPPHRIQVIIHELYQGTTMLATTQIHYRTFRQGNDIYKNIEGIEMNFPMQMYNRRGTRAHELTHAFTNIYLLPTWFAEGIAVLVQVEYAKDKARTKLDLHNNVKFDLDGINAAQTWRGHSNAIDSISSWGYDYSYSIVSELQRRYGKEFYPKLFRLIEEDQLHRRLPGSMGTSMLVYYMSQAAGQDLVPFFEDLKFQVRRLTKEDIMEVIRQATQ